MLDSDRKINYWTQQDFNDMVELHKDIDGEAIIVVTNDSMPTSLQKIMLERMNPSNTFTYATPEEVIDWLDDDEQW